MPRKMHVLKILTLAELALLVSSCAGRPIAQEASAAPDALPAAECVRVHDLSRLQLANLDANGAAIVEAWVEQVYRPNPAFWEGYLGGEQAFRQWAQKVSLKDDPRRGIPSIRDLSRDIRDVTVRAARLARRPVPCGDWTIVFGPGWTNLGGMGKLGMVVDFLGMPRARTLGDFDDYLPHEVNHLIWRAARGEAGAGTLLERMIDEGFATYFAQVYSRGRMSPSQTLGYTEAELQWALSHEARLWREAAPHLGSTDRAVLHRYTAAGARPEPAAPGKLGYFLGYRIVQAYVAKHGPNSWRDLYDMPLDRIVNTSGYGRAPA